MNIKIGLCMLCSYLAGMGMYYWLTKERIKKILKEQIDEIIKLKREIEYHKRGIKND